MAVRRAPRRSGAHRLLVGLAVALSTSSLALGVGACGGGDSADPPPAAPGANVDPAAGGVVGGSINRAKDVADDAESRDAQLEQQGGGGAVPAP